MLHFDITWLFILIIHFTGLLPSKKKRTPKTVLPSKKYISNFSPLKSCRKPGLETLRAESLKLRGRRKEKPQTKEGCKVMSHWLHLSVTHQPWHWHSQATHLPEEGGVQWGHLHQETVTASVWHWPAGTTGREAAINPVGGRRLLEETTR